MTPAKLQKEIYAHFRANPRVFPWRTTYDPYGVLISEVMLQQTQVDRVAPKYVEFLERFPDFAALAGASAADVLRAWQGLGYNRRALNLKRCAEEVVARFGGALPADPDALESLPGIGPYTARAVLAFAFDQPHAFIETNIRSVYIHFFFPRSKKVDDKKILALVESTMDRAHPREWFSALMDYGSMLKKKNGNPNHESKHYIRQPKFKGSNREVRGAILRLIARDDKPVAVSRIMKLPFPETQLKSNLEALETEGFIQKKQGKIALG